MDGRTKIMRGRGGRGKGSEEEPREGRRIEEDSESTEHSTYTVSPTS